MTRIVKPPSCEGCIGHDWTRDLTGFSNDEGYGTNGVLIVGEALGANEEQDGLPFRPYAQAGSLLEKAIRIAGFSRSQFRLTNCVRCRPPKDWLANAPWEFEALRHCRPNLDKSIADMKPRCILALGATALREITGMSGHKQGVSYLRGYTIGTEREVVQDVEPCPDCAAIGKSSDGCFLCDGTGEYVHYEKRVTNYHCGIPVVASFHPSFIRQGKPNFFGVLVHDLILAVRVAKYGWPARIAQTYQLHPSLDDARAFLHRVMDARGDVAWLTYDIETPTSADADEDERDDDPSFTIKQIQFSLGVGEGIVFPGRPEYLQVAREIMDVCGIRKVGHFSHLFDDPRLLANAFTIPEPTWDTYEMWHHMQPDLSNGLQFVSSFYGADFPWKHLGSSEPEFYGCCDVDNPQRILARLPQDMHARGLWQSYLRQVQGLRPILTRMADRGIPINDERRVLFGADLEAAMAVEYEDMQKLVPEECRNLHPKEGYKKEPKDKTGLVQRQFPGIDELTECGIPLDSGDLGRGYVTRWCRIEPFTPSPKQLIRYMKYRKHPVPKDLKTDNDTTAAKELERLAIKTDDPLYRRVITYRELQKMKGTYVDGWKPAADGCVHTTFTFAPATAQLSSRAPNIQNAPQHEKEGRETGLADKFLRCLEAPVGYKWVVFDHKSFHALTLAFLAEDAYYERIVRLDVHSFLASQFLRLDSATKLFAMPDDELRDYLKWIKKNHTAVRDGKAKRTILKWGFGGRYKSTYQMYRESFANETEAKRMEETLEGLFPKTVQYRLKICHDADKSPNFLKSPFGFIRWFWDVIDWRPPRSGSTKKCPYCGQHHGWGDQREQAIAFLPANCAFGMMREEMIAFEDRQLDGRYGLANNVHDAHYFLCPDDKAEECIYTVKSIMEAPSPKLVNASHPDGLWCATSVAVGRNLAKKSAANPEGKEEINVIPTQPSTPIVNPIGS